MEVTMQLLGKGIIRLQDRPSKVEATDMPAPLSLHGTACVVCGEPAAKLNHGWLCEKDYKIVKQSRYKS